MIASKIPEFVCSNKKKLFLVINYWRELSNRLQNSEMSTVLCPFGRLQPIFWLSTSFLSGAFEKTLDFQLHVQPIPLAVDGHLRPPLRRRPMATMGTWTARWRWRTCLPRSTGSSRFLQPRETCWTLKFVPLSRGTVCWAWRLRTVHRNASLFVDIVVGGSTMPMEVLDFERQKQSVEQSRSWNSLRINLKVK